MRDFEHTINVLADAHNKGDLLHGSCTACAVGNIVANACGYEIVTPDLDYRRLWQKDGNNIQWKWNQIFVTINGRYNNRFFGLYQHYAYADATAQVDATGYTVQELADIEQAYETIPSDWNTLGLDIDHRCYRLHRVIEMIGKIHGKSAGEIEDAKQKFTNVNAL